MAMHIPRAPGFGSMLKEGARHYAGLEEAVFRNIEACGELADTVKTAFGPSGMSKMVINHIEKLFVTNDAATVLRELEVQHPAAKLLVLASQQQDEECGDGTNLVLILAGALLQNARELIEMGLSVSEIASGYELASKRALEILNSLEVTKVNDLRDRPLVEKLIRSSVGSKQSGNEQLLARLISEACISTLSESNYFNVDNVRVCKIVGAGLQSSQVVPGMVFKRQVEGDVNRVEKARVAVYSCPIDILQTETKGTVLIKSGQELLDFSKGEENLVEKHVKAIVDSGATCVVSGGKVGDLALHYANQYKLMVVRLLSKFDLRRCAKSLGATPLVSLTQPGPDDLGYVDLVRVDEIGDTPVVIFKQEKDTPISTIVIRGSTDNFMDDVERAIDDGVNTYKSLTKDNRIVCGAGATEIELSRQLHAFADSQSGLEQYAVHKYADSLEAIVRALAENAGLKANEVLAALFAAHANAESQPNAKRIGIVLEPGSEQQTAVDRLMRDAYDAEVFDLLITKSWAIRFATQAACTVLKVDQIIMARQAGGPKPRENKNWDDD